jgi:von Hippel-Lindau disease tumor supressor
MPPTARSVNPIVLCVALLVSVVEGHPASAQVLQLPIPEGTSKVLPQVAGGSRSHRFISTRWDLDVDTENYIEEVVLSPVSGQAFLVPDPYPGQKRGFGNQVHVEVAGDHLGRKYVNVGHLASFLVKHGAYVEVGQPIGIEGCTGDCDGDHIHVGLQRGDPSRDAGSNESIETVYLSRNVKEAGTYRQIKSGDFVAWNTYQSANAIASVCRTTTWTFVAGSHCWTTAANGHLRSSDFDSGGAWILTIAQGDPQIISPAIDIDASQFEAIEVVMANAGADAQTQWFWAAPGQDFRPDRSTTPTTVTGGQYRMYRYPFPSSWNGRIGRLRFDPANDGIGRALGIRSIRLVPRGSQPDLSLPPPPPTGPATGLQACSVESQLRSTSGATAVPVEFVNTSSQTRRLYWLDYAGRRVYYAQLGTGQSINQTTYVTHPWVITTGNDVCLAIYVTTPDVRRVNITF